MNPALLSRRNFITAIPALITTAAVWRGRPLQAAAPQVRVGCQANGFPLKAGEFPSLLAALQKMHELGYTGFECNIRFVEGEFARVEEARKRIEDTGVAFIGSHLGMSQVKPDVFPRWLEKVAALGGKAIVMSGNGLAANGIFPREAALKKAAELDALGRQCRQAGLHLAYHNHNPEFANHNAEIEALAGATDATAVDFLMDAGHARLGGGDPAAFMRKFSGRILGCHLKTYQGPMQVPLGQGDWEFDDLAAAIKSTQWGGWLITEEGGGPKPGNTAALAPDRAYIRKVFGV